MDTQRPRGLRRRQRAGASPLRTPVRTLTGAPNAGRFLFLDPRAPDFFPDWHKLAREFVAVLRKEAGGNPFDKPLTDLIGELCTRSEAFRTWWADQDVYAHRSGTKRIRHHVVGEIEFSFESCELSADVGLTLVLYSAEPGSASDQALSLLASELEFHGTAESRGSAVGVLAVASTTATTGSVTDF